MEFQSYRIVFSKSGRIRFVGHLDLAQAFRRALKRAKIPVKYSSGFNPHMEFSIAMPLSLGMEGFGELLDIVVNNESEQFNADKLDTALKTTVPNGIEILDVFILPTGAKSAAADLNSAEFSVFLQSFNDLSDINSKIEKTLTANEIIVTKKTKKAEALTDIRPDIFSLNAHETDGGIIVEMVISAGSNRNLKPNLVMEHLLPNELPSIKVKYTRTRLITN